MTLSAMRDIGTCPHCGQSLVAEGEFRIGAAHWSPDRGLTYRGQRVPLPPQQAAIARALLAAGGATLTIDDLKAALRSPFTTLASIKVQLSHLRQTLRPLGGGWHILNEHGRGYKWME